MKNVREQIGVAEHWRRLNWFSGGELPSTVALVTSSVSTYALYEEQSGPKTLEGCFIQNAIAGFRAPTDLLAPLRRIDGIVPRIADLIQRDPNIATLPKKIELHNDTPDDERDDVIQHASDLEW